MSIENESLQLDNLDAFDAKNINFSSTLNLLNSRLGNPHNNPDRGNGGPGKRNGKPERQHTTKIDDQNGTLGNIYQNFQINQAENRYLENHETLSESEFNDLFSGKEDLQQGQLGDCYLVSGIIQLSNAQHFDTLMRTSVKRTNWPNGDNGYKIKIPFGEPSGCDIYIKDSELNVALIKGKIGYKLIELAFAKKKLGKYGNANTFYPITSQELKKIDGGWTKEALEILLGKNNIKFNTYGDKYRKMPLSRIRSETKKEITGFLRRYVPDIGNRFVSLSSIGGQSDENQYTVGGKTLYHKHAYALTGVNKDANGNPTSVTVLNPWNSTRRQGGNYLTFTIDEFFQAFSYMSCGTIKTNTFLDEKSTGIS